MTENQHPKTMLDELIIKETNFNLKKTAKDNQNLINHKKAQQTKRKYWLCAGIAGILLGGAVFGGVYYSNPDNNPTTKLSKTEQTSLIKAETSAVENNSKPADVIAGLSKRYDKLSGEQKEQAVELMYTSVQNASLYYNNAAYMMSGEISYSRPTGSNNSLLAARHNSWLGGFVADVRSQYLVPYNLNKGQILVLPNFDELAKYKSEATGDLKQLLLAGKETQSRHVFTDNDANLYQAALAYNDVIKRYPLLLNANSKSKYVNDMNSLGRIYHDIALGLITINNYHSVDGDKVQFDNQSYNQLVQIANNHKLYLYKEAQAELKHMNSKHQISKDYLEDQEKKSLETFGTSTYYQGKDDVMNLTQQAQQATQSSNANK